MSTITVEEALNLDLQGLFNRIWERAKDPVKALVGTELGDERCLYRAPNGKECFIGCCIPNEKYTEDMEAGYPNPVFLSVILDRVLPKILYSDAKLLQSIHDHSPPQDWKSQLEAFAATNCLTIPNE
jgi:hypothetical protein